MSELSAIILAAGQGKRMKSALPKVLHPIAGRPLVHYPVKAAVEAGAGRIVIVASPETREPLERDLIKSFGAERIRLTVQSPPRGTGDAARVGLDAVESDRVMILCGDTPLLRVEDLASLTGALDRGALLALLTCKLADPTGYGRVLRDSQGRVLEIREHRDLDNDAQRAVNEVNAGMYVAKTAFLREALARIQPHNAQGEYYLTDVAAMAAAQGGAEGLVGDPEGLVGVNDRAQLADAEQLLYRRIAQQLARDGASVRGDARIDDGVMVEADALIESGVVLRGRTRIGAGASVDIGAVLTDVDVAPGARVGAYAVLTGGRVGPGESVPPLTAR
jgi:bifunctional UDP-N-acetylglucosamine pyrophosphorylase/glucosamine-1-phosphate N-acetyltransferase